MVQGMGTVTFIFSSLNENYKLKDPLLKVETALTFLSLAFFALG